MRKRFDKSAEIDAASSLRLASMIRAHEGDYTDEEIVGIDAGKDRLKMFERMKTKNLKTESPSTEAEVAFEDNDSHAWGRATTTVRAEPTEVLAYALDYLKRSDDGVNRVEKSMKVVNDHNRELYARYKSSLISSRDFYSRQLWRKETDGSFILVATPMESEEHPKLPDVVRGRFPLVMKLVEEGEGTKVEYLIQIDFGGSVPAQVTNSYMGRSLTPMMEAMARRLVDEVGWAAKRRLFVGAALSTVDMITDVKVIVEYLNTPGKEAYAYPLMGMVGTCLFLQLLLVFMQTRKAPKAKMAKEMLIVLSGLKPGFDAYQVAKGAEQSAGAVFDPSTELVFTKGFEMVAESIPGCILQFYVLLKTLKDADGANTSSFMSLLISALSTGYSSATATWDYDTSNQRRRDEPEFYGMIPDGVRGNVVFLCMILNSALLLLVRSLSYALLMLVSPA
ncbi:hypothetical protein TeGR_g13866, partial [Tetraparma gracilis]